MAALTALSLAIGVGSMAYGIYQRSEGQDQVESGLATQSQGYTKQAEAATLSANISKEQAASSVYYSGLERDVNVKAANESVAASNASTAINKNIYAQKSNIEDIKMTAMEIDAKRQQLEILRNQQRARSLGLTNATSSGAQHGSGLQGGYGQTSGQTGVNLLGVQQNLQSGRNTYAANRNISNLNVNMTDLYNAYNVQQAENTTSKSNIAYGNAVANAGYTTRLADATELNSQGAGLVAQGGGQVSSGNSLINSGNSYFSSGPSIFSMGTNLSQLSGSTFNFGNYFTSTDSSGNSY